MTETISPALLLEVSLRVSAELGRARMPISTAVGLPCGAIVELDRSHDEPIDLYVNGRHFGTGRLLIVDGEWAVRIESVDGVADEGGVVLALAADDGDVVVDESPAEAPIEPGEAITPVDLSTAGQG